MGQMRSPPQYAVIQIARTAKMSHATLMEPHASKGCRMNPTGAFWSLGTRIVMEGVLVKAAPVAVDRKAKWWVSGQMGRPDGEGIQLQGRRHRLTTRNARILEGRT